MERVPSSTLSLLALSPEPFITRRRSDKATSTSLSKMLFTLSTPAYAYFFVSVDYKRVPFGYFCHKKIFSVSESICASFRF